MLGKNDVGRERLLTATERLLRTLPPARVTISRVAREAAVSPKLVRYYFGDRTALLVAVVDRVTAHAAHRNKPKEEPAVALANHIRRTVHFVRSATFMHRLMIEELTQAGTKESRARVKAMNLELVQFYREVLRTRGRRQLSPVDPLFLHLAVLGASDFFSSAESLIRELLPPGADMAKLALGFQEFLVSLVLEGVRKR